MTARKIFWIEETQEWRTTGIDPKIINPTIGDLIDVLASDKMWVVALKRRNLDIFPIYGTEEFVQVVGLKTVNSQSKVVMKGFRPRQKRRY